MAGDNDTPIILRHLACWINLFYVIADKHWKRMEETRAEGSSGADLGEDLWSSMCLVDLSTDGYQRCVDL